MEYVTLLHMYFLLFKYIEEIGVIEKCDTYIVVRNIFSNLEVILKLISTYLSVIITLYPKEFQAPTVFGVTL